MRLTLRTLLAHMDDILEPEDREDISTKVRESEFASSLVHRIRDVTRRMRLGAPQVIGTGMGRDPNSVAEYLDNTLAVEQIQLFEKVCLESDVHLAEAGSCHHILTMILGEPARFDPATRERMYTLIEEAAAARAGEVATAAAAAEAASVPAAVVEPLTATIAPGLPVEADDQAAMRRKPEVPEYLRTSGGPGWKTIVLTLVGAALATAIALAVLFPDSILVPLGLRQPAQVTQTPGTQQSTKSPGEKVATPSDKSQGGTKTPPAELPTRSPKSPPETANGASDKLPAVPPAAVPLQPDTLPKSPPDAPLPDAGEKHPPDAPGTAPAGGTKDPGVVAVPIVVPPAAPVGKAPIPDTPPPPVAAKEPDKVATLDPKVAPVPPALEATPVVVGNLISQSQVMLRSKSADRWERLPKDAPLHAGDRLLVLPAFRPLVKISGVTLHLDGPTEVELQASGAEGPATVVLRYGRIVFSPNQPNASLRINTGAGEGMVTLNDADASVGIEARLIHLAGRDPEKEAPRREVDFFAGKGNATWAMGNGTAPLKGPAHVRLFDGALVDQGTTVPGWVAAAQVSPLDARAAQRIDEAMTADRSIKLSLAELLQQQRIEVRSLAARCSAYVGMFDPLVNGLSDEEQRAGWLTFVSELRAAVARDPQTATVVRETLERIRREKAPDLYRMLWGYTPDGLKNGDARTLVKWLDHDDLEFRVLSFMNLQEITGMGLNYRPEYNVSKRKPSLIRWQKRLDEKKIVFVNGAATAAAPKAAPPEPAKP